MRECKSIRNASTELELTSIESPGGKRGKRPIPKPDKAKVSIPTSTSASSNSWCRRKLTLTHTPMTSSLPPLSNDANETLKRFEGSLRSVSAKKDWLRTKPECERLSSLTLRVVRTGQLGTAVPAAVAAPSLTARVSSPPKRKRSKMPCAVETKGRSKLGVMSEERQVSDNAREADLPL